MGILRGGLIALASLILFISLLLGNIFLIISLSLDYDTINPELTKITTDIANNEANINQIIETSHPLMIEACKNQTEIQLTNYSLPYSYSIPCGTIEEGPSEIINDTIEKIIEKAYYKDYDCKFSECITDSPLYIISETNKNNLKSKFNKSLILSLILIAIIFVFVEKKRSTLTVAGIVMFLATLPLIKIDYPIKIFSKTMGILPFTKQAGNYLSELLLLLFTKTQTVFNFSIALATMLIVLGIGLGFLKILTKEKKFTKKDVEEIVEKKLSKEKKK